MMNKEESKDQEKESEVTGNDWSGRGCPSGWKKRIRAAHSVQVFKSRMTTSVSLPHLRLLQIFVTY